MPAIWPAWAAFLPDAFFALCMAETMGAPARQASPVPCAMEHALICPAPCAAFRRLTGREAVYRLDGPSSAGGRGRGRFGFVPRQPPRPVCSSRPRPMAMQHPGPRHKNRGPGFHLEFQHHGALYDGPSFPQELLLRTAPPFTQSSACSGFVTPLSGPETGGRRSA